MALLGEGTKLKFDTLQLEAQAVRISGDFKQYETLENVTLASTGGMQKLVSAIHDAGEFRAEVNLDYTTLKTLSGLQGAAKPFEIAFPLQAGQTTPAKITGNAYLVGLPLSLEPRVISRGELRFVITGDITFVDPT
ncbi:MAG: hypothetical protein KatS3mg038_3945 [Candidatus Kapaibacterium sp.]|nr:MAG: hypothetical protein KatS3mg038_1830 [Candidatus Kapabacteria bacterium]GIV53424.1 MAG: hypothetical protein KatS3mg038_3945 [Candidatus Kapabacteria bacterium]